VNAFTTKLCVAETVSLISSQNRLLKLTKRQILVLF
jgi:hypothetical protein